MQVRGYISLNMTRRKLKTDNMVWLLCIHHHHVFLIFYIFIAAVIVSDTTNINIHEEKNLPLAYAHIFSDTPNTITKNIDKYQVVFLPYPSVPLPNDNSTRLNFSLMENKTDVYNVF